jgi:hypothetical protein
MVVGGMAAMAAGAGMATWDGSATRRDSAEASASATAESVSVGLAERLGDLGNMALLLADDPAVTSFFVAAAGPTDDDVLLADVSNRLLTLEQLPKTAIASASVIDANGIERARVVEGDIAAAQELGADLSAASFLDGADSIPAHTPAWSEPYFSSHTGEPVVAAIVKLSGVDGTPVGYLKVEAALSRLSGFGSSNSASMATARSSPMPRPAHWVNSRPRQVWRPARSWRSVAPTWHPPASPST